MPVSTGHDAPRARMRTATDARTNLTVPSAPQLGLKWSKVSQQLPGRTAHAIRNRFHRLQQLQVEQQAAAAKGPAGGNQWQWQPMVATG